MAITGRPKWVPTDEINEQAREMASRALTVAQIADCLGLGERTVRWSNRSVQPS